MFFCYALALLCATSCVKLQRRPAPSVVNETSNTAPAAPRATTASPVNINRATLEELERLPGVGPALARRIVEHRERYGRFRRVEHLLVVRGISERRFAGMRAHV